MKEKIDFIVILLLLGLLISCNQNRNKTINDSRNQSDLTEIVLKTPQISSIEGEDIVIRVGPGENFDKLINKKATEALGETHYAQVDYSVKVIVEELEDDWSKIRVVDPEWLSKTHIGWIPTKNIIMEQKVDNTPLEKLDPKNYEILKSPHAATVQNFEVWIKFKDFNQEKVKDFIKRFRNEYCTIQCNVSIYDSKEIIDLIDMEPLEGKDYIKVADHFVAISTFDSPDYISWYPFQDFLYKDFGGINWKKEPVK